MPVRTHESSRTLVERIGAKAVQARDAASPEERESVAALVAKAQAVTNSVDRIMERVLVTPSMAAILFLDHNGYNRDWDAKVSAQYAAMMLANKWRTNSQSVYALYKETGDVGDGSHRLGGQVWADATLDMYFCLGVSLEDVATLDCGKSRTPADTCKLLGVANAKDKFALLTNVWNYFIKIGLDIDSVESSDVNGVAMKIREHDKWLSRALDIGSAASSEADEKLISDALAARIAGIMLQGGWDEAKIGDRLAELQTEEWASDNSPLAFARERFAEHSQATDVWSASKQVAVIIKAVMMAEEGLEITSRQQARARQLIAAAKNWPDPRVQDFAAAAE